MRQGRTITISTRRGAARGIYRQCRRRLYREMASSWRGTREVLRRTIGRFLKPLRRKLGFLFRVVREAKFAALVAGAVLAGAGGSAGAAPIELSDIAINANTGGFAMDGETSGDQLGNSVSAAGDVNGDGLADLIVAAYRADGPNGPVSGRSYVIFGKADGTLIDLSDIATGMGGFVINGGGAFDLTGRSVSGAGDVNGDGLADLIVGEDLADPNGSNSGRVYVIFGKADGTAIELSDVSLGAGGFSINGETAGDRLGFSVSGAGDVNGDGLADLIVSAFTAGPNGFYSGRNYVVFGKADGALVQLSDVTAGMGGFTINGETASDTSGWSVSEAGDVNGDGLVDLIVGAPFADLGGRGYVIFGKADGTLVQLSDVTAGTGGFTINGEAASDGTGISVSGAGDVNGDGLADLIVGANGADPNSGGSGRSYVIFGKADGTLVELSNVTADMGGFTINGEAFANESGASVSAAGDVNGDGLTDLIIGAFRASPNNYGSAGRSYVVFSTISPPADSGPYKMRTLAGDGADGMVAPVTDFGDVARAKIDFSDEDTGDNGAGGSSLETVTITRSSGGITNLNPVHGLADVVWQLTTDRAGFDTAEVTLKYLDNELGGNLGGESALRIITAPALDGPWTEQTSTVDTERNEVKATVSGFSFFGIAGVITGAEPIELSDIAAGAGGFVIDGEAADDESGYSVSAVGDVNGDGLADLIVGAFRADPNGSYSGRSYVVFGKADEIIVQLSDVTAGMGGFAIDGEDADDRAGFSVSAAGDVNGDGLADLIVGAFGADPNGTESGRSYVVFGKADGTLVELSDVAAGTGGFTIDGEAAFDISGVSVSAAGDVNGDGLADLIVGAFAADPNGASSGQSYVVFGKADGTAVQLSNITAGLGGFAINGEAGSDKSGVSVSAAGDVNGDGLADLIVAADGADPNGSNSGRGYVVFGKASGVLVELSDVTAGAGGFAINGEAVNDHSGNSVSAAGDVNGDGLADLIIGAWNADPNGSSSGRSYVVFGKADGPTVQLSDVTAGSGGFVIDGEVAGDSSGISVSEAGDVNGDGLADLIVGAFRADPNGSNSGRSYVVFGKADGTTVDLSDVATGMGGFTMNGKAAFNESGRGVSGAGDINGDGLADLIVGAYHAEPNGSRSGRSYVVFNPFAPPADSGPYLMPTLAGDGVDGMVSPVTDFGDVARVKIDFSDGDVAMGGGLDDSSLETVTITRSSNSITNLDPNSGLADVVWQLATDRIGFDSAEVTLKYLDGELGDIVGDESILKIFTASALDGPWTEQATTVNSARNEAKATVSGFSYFALGAVNNGEFVWIDFGYSDTELGTITMPFNTMAEAVAFVIDGGTIFIRGDTGTPSTSETITIVRPLRLEADGGPVTIGR